MKKLRPYQEDAVNTILKNLKESTDPVLVDASVGSGKSLMCARVLLRMERADYRALCLTLNSTLIQQNAQTYESEGGTCGIYAASINKKETEQLIIFGSPQSVCNSIRDNKDIAHCRFNLLIIDECHQINYSDPNTLFMRIIRHYRLLAQTHGYNYRIVGLSGTCYRGKGISIIGKDQLFKNLACSISTSWLISQGYLTKPVFGLTEAQGYDFSNIRVNSMGKFSGTELQTLIDSNERLTSKIMLELQEVMKTRVGAFIFAATRKHCEECSRSLPDGEWAIITGTTPHEDRARIIQKAKEGVIRYLINVNCLVTGIDISSFDVCCWCRPTESLLLYTQGIGRVLRLHDGKVSALVLDYAGNLDRHGDIDDPIINQAIQPKEENEKEYIIPCLTCGTNNCPTARRCIGVHNNKRCDHYFEWKECPKCRSTNDIVSRHCRECGYELIDPNAKLQIKPCNSQKEIFTVLEAKFWVMDNGSPTFYANYLLTNGLRIYESFSTKNELCRNIFYAKFVKTCVKNASQYYPHLGNINHLRNMIASNEISVPNKVECILKNSRYHIHKRIFEYEKVSNA